MATDRSARTAGITYTRDTRFGLPFPTAGTMQSISAQFTGGRWAAAPRSSATPPNCSAFAPLAQVGGIVPGTQPMVLTAGLTTHAGAVFGDTGPFFFSQEFALGGVQYR